MRIVVLRGDGIGPEISAATLNVLQVASRRFELNIQLEAHAVGHESLQRFGSGASTGKGRLPPALLTNIST
jgi:3-isopropylmalate dehydrogenase